MLNKGVRRIIALAIVLLIIPCSISLAQCRKDLVAGNSFITQGIIDGPDFYYQNLIVQDIALASQQPFSDISLRFDYLVHYQLDQCRNGQAEIRVYSPEIKGAPLYYLGYDISYSIRPEKADLVFNIVMPGGLIVDSLVLQNIPVEKKDELYSSLSLQGIDTTTAIVIFSRAIFYYTKSSYESFRDHLLQIDKYYAAALLADSAKKWALYGFLSETSSRHDMILRQCELERISNYINPFQFDPVLSSLAHDKAGLSNAYHELLSLNTRYKAIIKYNHGDKYRETPVVSDADRVNLFLGWLDYYYQFAFQSDFRYVNFLEGLSVPHFTNTSIVNVNRLFKDYKIPANKSQFLQKLLVTGFATRGKEYEMEGNQLRALSFYKTANHLSKLLHFNQVKNNILKDVNRMRDSIAASYLAISRKSAQTGNPVFAAQYYDKAVKLFEENDANQNTPSWLTDHENWLFHDFENQVVKCLDVKNYDKALIYLNEIQLHCLSVPDFPYPALFNEWMRTARNGIYLALLKKATVLYSEDEYPEAAQNYQKAMAIRIGAGYRIDKDLAESELERNFRQAGYDEMLEEGMKFYRKQEHITALYYFNRAIIIEKSGVIRPYPDLLLYRQESARVIILQNLSEGRVRAWAHDFTGAESMLQNIEKMLSYYQVNRHDSLYLQYVDLNERVRQAECDKVMDEFNLLIAGSLEAEKNVDFTRAQTLASEAADLSMANLKCRINDEQAWYRKFNLESPANFQRMEKDLAAGLVGDCSRYLEKYQDLKKYHQKHRLQTFGIVFTPLFERISVSTDSAFLACMFRHYIRQRNYDLAFQLLYRMKGLGIESRSLTAEQDMLAVYMAGRDVQNPAGQKPWELLSSYTGKDKWYRPFNKSYKMSWLKSTDWKMSNWPLIWK
jgi:tetratricopeptide (TPR) repeat protein